MILSSVDADGIFSKSKGGGKPEDVDDKSFVSRKENPKKNK